MDSKIAFATGEEGLKKLDLLEKEEKGISFKEYAKELVPLPQEPYKSKDIIEKMDLKFAPTDNNVWVKPMPVEMIKKTLTILDEPKNKNLKPGDTMHTKDVTKTVETDFRKGVILGMGKRASKQLLEEENIQVGDTIIFHKNLVDHASFDLFKDSLMVNTYDIKAKYLG